VWNHFWQEAYNRPILDFFHRAAKAEPKAPAYDRPGPHAVETLDFPGLRDQARDSRRVPVKVHAPRGAGPFPLVVFSHGGGGNRDSYVYLVRHLASHGYVVACPEHVFSNAAILRHYLGPAGGSMKFMESLQRITTDPRAVLERPRDVSFAIDRAVGWNRSHSRLKGRIDCSKVGVMGHSYGAYTALVVCGAKPLLDHLVPAVAPGKGLAKDDLRDGRVTFGVALSQQGPGTTFFGPESFKSIDRPLLCVSGTKDVMKGDRGQTLPAAARLAAFRDLYPAGGRSLLWLHGADHFAFADSTKAYLMPSPSRPDVQRIARAFLVAASHAHLRGDKEARKRLGRDYAGTLLGPVVDGAHWHEK